MKTAQLALSLPPQPTALSLIQILEIYVDLTPDLLRGLLNPAQASFDVQQTLVHRGWLTEDTLTANGRSVMVRGERIANDEFVPPLPHIVLVGEATGPLCPVADLSSQHLAVLLTVACRPDIAWGYLCQSQKNGQVNVQYLWQQGYLGLRYGWGAPQRLLRPAWSPLSDALSRSGVEYEANVE